MLRYFFSAFRVSSGAVLLPGLTEICSCSQWPPVPPRLPDAGVHLFLSPSLLTSHTVMGWRGPFRMAEGGVEYVQSQTEASDQSWCALYYCVLSNPLIMETRPALSCSAPDFCGVLLSLCEHLPAAKSHLMLGGHLVLGGHVHLFAQDLKTLLRIRLCQKVSPQEQMCQRRVVGIL